jgi:hypothetical protein
MRNAIIGCAIVVAFVVVCDVGGADPSVAGRFAAMAALCALGVAVRKWMA